MNMKKRFLSSLILLIIFSTSCNKEPATLPYATYETQIMVAGAPNMRDLGGFYGENGKRVLYHKLFRCGDLSKLTTSDLDTLSALGINQVIDLRKSAEIASAPDILPQTGVTSTNLPLFASVNGGLSDAQIIAGVLQGTISVDAINQHMISLYNTIDSLKIANWTKALAILQTTGNTTLFHCKSGKDRTGMTAALILFSVGVSQNDIVGDFMASNIYLSKTIAEELSALDSIYGAGSSDKLKPLFGVQDFYIYAFFNAVNAKYGSMDNFLSSLGVYKTKMRALYLEK